MADAYIICKVAGNAYSEMESETCNVIVTSHLWFGFSYCSQYWSVRMAGYISQRNSVDHT